MNFVFRIGREELQFTKGCDGDQKQRLLQKFQFFDNTLLLHLLHSILHSNFFLKLFCLFQDNHAHISKTLRTTGTPFEPCSIITPSFASKPIFFFFISSNNLLLFLPANRCTIRTRSRKNISTLIAVPVFFGLFDHPPPRTTDSLIRRSHRFFIFFFSLNCLRPLPPSRVAFLIATPLPQP